MKIAPPPFGGFGLVLSDFPTHFDTHSNSGQAKSASQHYPTMSTTDIIALYKDLRLEWICAPDCVHFMWTTWPLLARGDAHAIMAAYGFKCVSGGNWTKATKNDKDGFGNGYMFRDSGEPFLIGTRGNPGQPPRGARNVRNCFRAKRGRHSEKPDYLHRAAERMYPKAAKLELFARAHRPGWTCWGLEVDGDLPDYQPPGAKPMIDGPLLKLMDTEQGKK